MNQGPLVTVKQETQYMLPAVSPTVGGKKHEFHTQKTSDISGSVIQFHLRQ